MQIRSLFLLTVLHKVTSLRNVRPTQEELSRMVDSNGHLNIDCELDEDDDSETVKQLEG